MDLQDVVNDHPVPGFRRRVIVLCLLVAAIDGFDTAAVGFIAPALRAGFGVAGAQVGVNAPAATTGRRIAAVPTVPTVAEAGLPGYVLDPWFAMLAPRGLPEEARARAARQVALALQDATRRERFAAIGAEPMEGDGATLGRLLAEETARWGDLVRRLDIRPTEPEGGTHAGLPGDRGVAPRRRRMAARGPPHRPRAHHGRAA
jgi:hypothetical protein